MDTEVPGEGSEGRAKQQRCHHVLYGQPGEESIALHVTAGPPESEGQQLEAELYRFESRGARLPLPKWSPLKCRTP